MRKTNIIGQIIRKFSFIFVTSLITIVCSSNVLGGVGSFYKGENRYRGFYWFEDNKVQAKDLQSFNYLTPEEAQDSIEARKKAMDDARSQMIELGFREDTPSHILRKAIVKYKKLEANMHDGVLRLVRAAEETNLTNREIADVMNFPTNVFANKLKRKVEEQEKIGIIQSFAKKFDLVLFTSSDCPYCLAFIPVITNFSREYGFTLETTSLDSKEGKLAQKLGITQVPTLVAVSRDGSRLFELSRGLQSVSELEASVVTANNLILEDRFGVRQKGRR